jgi:hypothetical protein
MILAQHQQVFVRLPSGDHTGQTYYAGIVTAVWPDDTGNTDCAETPVLCSVCVLPWQGGEPARCVGAVNVYANESESGNAAIDNRGYAFVTRDMPTAIAAFGLRPWPRA